MQGHLVELNKKKETFLDHLSIEAIEERKKRTHLLCQIGGTVEKVLDRPLVEEDVMRLLNFLNQQERNGKYFTRAMEKCPDTGSEMEGTEND